MVEDEQTHAVPESDAGLAALAAFTGFADTEAFSKSLVYHLEAVETHYAALFEDAPDLSAGGAVRGNLVFTGAEPDPDTLKTLERLGYTNPRGVDDTVRGWHHGRYRAMRSTRARELLTELMPKLLGALADTPNPDGAFSKFDEFLSRLPSGVQLFSMFYANPHLLELVAEIMGVAPRLAEHLSHRPSTLEGVLSPDFFDDPPSPETLDEELDRLLVQARGFEDVLDISRRWANDRRFQAGVLSLRDSIQPRTVALALSNIADTALSRLLPRVEDEFAAKHGRVPDSGMAVVAMGKLGGREMTPTSDLDLIFIYDAPPDVEQSDGPKPLAVTQYFARLSQRLINAVTAHTAEGVLYEVDMRLRPSGNAGPIASSLEAFARYQREAAWTWEHMALTRARVVAGPAALRTRIESVIAATLTRPRDTDRLLRDVATMRARMDKEHHSDFIWEIKHMRGGLVDIEFLAQYFLLTYAHGRPEILGPNTRATLIRIRDAGLLADGVGDTLIRALDLWSTVQGMLRLTIDGFFRRQREDELTVGLQKVLSHRAGTPDIETLKDQIRETAKTVHGHFVDLVERPAQALPGAVSAEDPGPAFAGMDSPTGFH